MEAIFGWNTASDGTNAQANAGAGADDHNVPHLHIGIGIGGTAPFGTFPLVLGGVESLLRRPRALRCSFT